LHGKKGAFPWTKQVTTQPKVRQGEFVNFFTSAFYGVSTRVTFASLLPEKDKALTTCQSIAFPTLRFNEFHPLVQRFLTFHG
jgi:hypothetical protein